MNANARVPCLVSVAQNRVIILREDITIPTGESTMAALSASLSARCSWRERRKAKATEIRVGASKIATRSMDFSDI